MTRHEQVVFALHRIRVAHQAAFGPHRIELRISACDQLVRIDLMSRVPNEPVVLKIERLVQREAQFDNAKVRRKMRATARHQVTKHLAHFGGQFFELRKRELAQILRRMNRSEDGSSRH